MKKQFNKSGLIQLCCVALFGVCGFTFAASSTTSATATDSKASYSATKDAADAEYKAAREKCGALSGNAKDVCLKEAHVAQVRTTADAEYQYKHTPAQYSSSRKRIADAEYDLAKERCDDKAGNAKDVCVKEAKAAHVTAIADAKSDRKVTNARKDANEDKRDAEYQVAAEKCDALAGDAKDNCVRAAKSTYGK